MRYMYETCKLAGSFPAPRPHRPSRTPEVPEDLWPSMASEAEDWLTLQDWVDLPIKNGEFP